MNAIKFYSSKSNARRAAKAAGLNPDELEYFTNGEGGWAWHVEEPEFAPDASQVLADEIGGEDPADEEINESIADQQKAADAKANQAEFVGEDGEAEKVGKIEVTHESTIKRPCKQVWHIADSMPGAKRKEVIAACVAQGIAYYTARTQYQQWLQTVKSQTATQASSK